MRKIHITLLILIIILINILTEVTFSQQKIKASYIRKVPKISLIVTTGFSYCVGSANGEGTDFKSIYNPEGGNIFNSKNLGMQEGYGLNLTGKFVISKNKKLSIICDLGYIHFYNSTDKGLNRTRWNLFNFGGGVQYNFTPKEKESVYLNFLLNYNLLFGAWQSNITYPDGYVSNIYTKFNPASRFGISASAGMQIKLSKKTDLVFSIKGAWANIFPKSNYYSNRVFYSYINDSGNSNGIEMENKKNIIYLQINAGIVFPLKIR